MSEKRFTIEESENQLIIFDNGVSDETYFHLGNDDRDVKYVCDLLNTLHQENQQLKHYKLYEDNKRLQTIIADLKEKNEQLKKEKESWKSIACQDLSKWSIFSNEVSVLYETRDIERFLEKYYEYCADMVMNDE